MTCEKAKVLQHKASPMTHALCTPIFYAAILCADLHAFPKPVVAASPRLGVMHQVAQFGFGPVAVQQTQANRAKPSAQDNSDAIAEPGSKRKARLLAAAGLAIISVLVLATGIALLRAFRQR